MATTITVYEDVNDIGVVESGITITVYEMFIGVGPQGPTGATGPAGAAAVAGELPSSFVEMTTPVTVTSATLVDITGATTTITLDSTVNIAVFMDCEISSDGACDLGLAISINGTDHDVVTTHLFGATSDPGKSSVIHRTATPLAAGTYTVKGRFLRSSGTKTPQVDRADLLVFALQGAKGADGVDGVDGITPDAIHAAVNKDTPVDADEIGIWDSVSGLLNKLSWANIKATLKTYFDTLYASLTAPIKETSGPTVLTTGAIADGEYLVRSGTTIIGGTPAGGGGGVDWTDDANTWTYSSADAPVFVASVNADMTAVIYPGYRLSLTQTTEKFFIIHAVGAYSGGATLITIYGGTDYTLTADTITSPKYSNAKCPPRFPMSPAKWSVKVTDTQNLAQNSPTQNVWYNLGSVSITIPIGIWDVSYFAGVGGNYNTTSFEVQCTLSTANNSESDAEFTVNIGFYHFSITPVYKNKKLILATKTPYYFNTRTNYSSVTAIKNANNLYTCVLIAVDTYL